MDKIQSDLVLQSNSSLCTYFYFTSFFTFLIAIKDIKKSLIKSLHFSSSGWSGINFERYDFLQGYFDNIILIYTQNV